jgi:hypothetical protein
MSCESCSVSMSCIGMNDKCGIRPQPLLGLKKDSLALDPGLLADSQTLGFELESLRDCLR